MKRVLVASIALFGFATTAIAQDDANRSVKYKDALKSTLKGSTFPVNW